MNATYKADKHPSSRDRVLKYLESKKGSYVSGQKIASELELSRTAVWKAVQKLKSEGFNIDAVTNRGYCLPLDYDVLSAEKIYDNISGIVSDRGVDTGIDSDRAFLAGTRHFNMDSLYIKVYDTIDSTNALCMRMASEGAAGGFIAVAGSQSRGRGRRGRTFYSPEDTGLYLSILLRPSGLSSKPAMRFTTIAAVAVSEAIEAVSGRKADIKWVNDIYVDGRKVCGILTEASFNLEDYTLAYAVVGIGINVYEPEDGFPDVIKDVAGAISPCRSGAEDINDPVLKNGGRNRLAAEIITRFYSYCVAELNSQYSNNPSMDVKRYIDEYRKRCFVIGHDVDVLKAGSAPVRAHVSGLDDECGLNVIYEDGSRETLTSGEISIRLH